MTEFRFRTQYDPPLDTGLDFSKEEKLTKDSFKEESDINVIMKRAAKTGQLPAPSGPAPQFGDFSTVPDYLEASQIVARAEEAFYALAPEVREACLNDPAVFLDRLQDPDFRDKYGLSAGSEAEAAPSSQPAPSTTEPPAPEGTGETKTTG